MQLNSGLQVGSTAFSVAALAVSIYTARHQKSTTKTVPKPFLDALSDQLDEISTRVLPALEEVVDQLDQYLLQPSRLGQPQAPALVQNFGALKLHLANIGALIKTCRKQIPLATVASTADRQSYEDELRILKGALESWAESQRASKEARICLDVVDPVQQHIADPVPQLPDPVRQVVGPVRQAVGDLVLGAPGQEVFELTVEEVVGEVVEPIVEEQSVEEWQSAEVVASLGSMVVDPTPRRSRLTRLSRKFEPKSLNLLRKVQGSA